MVWFALNIYTIVTVILREEDLGLFSHLSPSYIVCF